MEKLDFNIGALLHMQLQTGEGKQRHDVHLIGMQPGESLLVSMPRVNGILPKIFPNDEYIVRYFAGTTVVAFKTSVLLVCQIPYYYMHLKYPNKLESVTVRQAERIEVSITAQVTKQDQKVLGSIKDLSALGAMILMEEGFGEPDEHIELFFDLHMGEFDKSVHLVGVIRNKKKNNNLDDGEQLYRYGIEFIDPSEEDVVFLQGYVYEQLLYKREHS